MPRAAEMGMYREGDPGGADWILTIAHPAALVIAVAAVRCTQQHISLKTANGTRDVPKQQKHCKVHNRYAVQERIHSWHRHAFEQNHRILPPPAAWGSHHHAKLVCIKV